MVAKTDKFDWAAYAPEEGDEHSGYMTFTNPGDKITGKINKIAAGEDFNGDLCPQLTIEDTIVTCGNYDLKRKVVAAAPQVGDHVTITFTEMKGRMKAFTITVEPF